VGIHYRTSTKGNPQPHKEDMMTSPEPSEGLDPEAQEIVQTPATPGAEALPTSEDGDAEKSN
jgi:hypothetical protein